MVTIRQPLWPLAFAVAAVIFVGGRHHPRRVPSPRPVAKLPAALPKGPHPRILLDEPARKRLRDAARTGTPAWRRVAQACEEDLTQEIRSGYAGFDWGEAVADLALCWRATGERRFAEGALRYLRALLDDRYLLHDGRGGDNSVRHDSGYPMRSFGVYVALAYDWLFDAPGMTPALRSRIIARLDAWISWYRDNGYQRDRPIANYFCGYLLATTFAGIAAFGEAPEGKRWWELAYGRLLARQAIPDYASLEGGDWPEGWQYGELSAAEVALAVAAIRTAIGVDLLKQIPWLRAIVAHHKHALLPGGAAVYDNGDWDRHPAQPSRTALLGLLVALDPADSAAAEARWMIRRDLPPAPDENAWVALLADRPGAPESDPRAGAPTSIHLPGTGVSFLRSDWTPRAVWLSVQAGPTLADHQHADQGHFELVRGGDALLVDGGAYGSAATLSHNTLLVDDGGHTLNYPPNQGVWGRSTRTTRFLDDGTVALVEGDLADAYAPACAEDGCGARAVHTLVRTVIYLRPATLLVDDRVVLDSPDSGFRWATHLPALPRVDGPAATAQVGTSRVTIRTILPAGARFEAYREPTGSGEGPYRRNEPWGPVWRLEAEAPRGKTSRRFLHLITAEGANDAARRIVPISGNGLSGAIVDGAAILRAEDEAGGDVTLAGDVRSVAIAALRPSARYRLHTGAAPGGCCSLSITPSPDGKSQTTSSGSLTVSLSGCHESGR